MGAPAPAKKAVRKAAPRKMSPTKQLLGTVVPDGPQDEPAVEVEEFEGFDLDALDKATLLPNIPTKLFWFVLKGHKYFMQDPRDVDWKKVLDGINNPLLFMRLSIVGTVTELPADATEEQIQAADEADKKSAGEEADRFVEVDLPGWKLSALFDNWQTYYKVESIIDLNKLLAARRGPEPEPEQ